MNPSAHSPRHGLWLRLLKASLVAGAIYDLIFALLMFFAPWVATRLLELEPPSERYYLWLIAVLLCMLAGVYLLAAYDPRSYRGVIPLAVIGRAAGFVVLLLCAAGRPDLWGLYPLAFADLAFAVAHALFWWPIRK